MLFHIFYQIRTNDDEKGNIFLIYVADNFVREYQKMKYISNYACLNFSSYLFIVVTYAYYEQLNRVIKKLINTCILYFYFKETRTRC